MKIVLIGAGNLATNLGCALLAANHEVVQVYSRTRESAELLAEKLKCLYVTSPDDLLCDAELYIVALKDSVLSDLLPILVRGREQALWVHTAGSIPLAIWQHLGVKNYGVFYPLQTFSKTRWVDFSDISIFIEANNEDSLLILEKLAASLTSKVYKIDSVQRCCLHLAAVFSCNFTNAMYAVASNLLKEYGLPFEALLPLIDETSKKVHVLTPLQAQTGPAVRYDRVVMDGHLAMLEHHPLYQQVYELISRCIHEEQIKYQQGEI